ncbi:MAG: S41 family peptidase [Phycisphaerales bacterium]
MASRNTVPLLALLGVAVIGSTIAVATNAIRTTTDDYGFFDPIVDVHSLIEELYVDEDHFDDLQTGAINGMIDELNDPYTTFVPRQDTEKFARDLTGEYVGIGAEVQMRDGWLTISSPLDGSPAWKAGVMADDRVVKIDGESTEGQTIDDAIDRLIGEPDTPVVITVERDGKTLDIEIIRGHIKVQAVKGFMREHGDGEWDHLIDVDRNIGYIRLTQFTPKAALEVIEAINNAENTQQRQLNGLILDLRFNPGGLLDEAVKIADMFIDEGTIVSTKGRVHKEQVVKAHEKNTIKGMPLVVLVNGQSASASEVLSGALSDHDRAVVIGTRSFGKGSVQTVRQLESGDGVLKITEQYYYLPSGRLLHRRDDSTQWGVDPTPGYYVPVTNEQMGEMLTARREQEVISTHKEHGQVNLADTDAILEALQDPQLTAAVRVLQHRVDTGEFAPVGIKTNEPDDVALAELNALRTQEERMLRELTRIAKRVEAVEQGVDEQIVDENPRDFWDDDLDLKGGEMVIRDPDGHVVTTLKITGQNLERWLLDADVEKEESEQAESVSP